jgi:hypothetical protein
MTTWTPQTSQARAAMFKRISASLLPDQAITAFAGGTSAHTILSPPAVQHALLGFFTTPAVLPLRAAFKDACAAVARHAWRDRDTVIRGSIAAWRRCFPRAQCASVSERNTGAGHRRALVMDADLAHLRGVLELNMSGCDGVTAAAFEHLRGIRTLDVSWCKRLSAAALEPLRGIHTLNLSYSTGITDAALAHLAGIHTLDVGDCTGITDAGAAHLAGIHTLNAECSGVTGAAFEHLRGIYKLNVFGCTGITDAALAYLRGIRSLEMLFGPDITDAAFEHLRGIRALDMYGSPSRVTSAGLAHLRGIRSLRFEDPGLHAMAQGLGLPIS